MKKVRRINVIAINKLGRIIQSGLFDVDAEFSDTQSEEAINNILKQVLKEEYSLICTEVTK